MATVISIDNFRTSAPFEDYGITKDDYLPIDTVLDTNIMVSAVEIFNNEKGEGAYILASAGAVKAGEPFYICTHAIGLVNTLNKPELLQALAEGNTITCRITKRKSKTSDRQVYAFA